jgi:hypothetical protein
MDDDIAKVVRLFEILEQPPEVSLRTRLSELEQIVDSLRPEDFGLLGKSLCRLLINIASLKRIQFVDEKAITLPPPVKLSTPRKKSQHRGKGSGSPFYTEYPDFIPTVDHHS